MNKVILLGNLGTDPELKTTNSGKSVVSFSLATSAGKDSPTEWHKIEAWDKTANFIANYFTKGSKMALEGRIKYSMSEKDGEKKYYTTIVADRVEFAGGKGDGGAAAEEDPF